MSYGYAVSKVVHAPVSTVWQAWTTKNGTAGIFRARPETVPVDARVGGRFAVTMTLPDGSEESIGGTYVDLVPGERLATSMDTPDGRRLCNKGVTPAITGV